MSADDQWRRPVEYGPRGHDGPVPQPASGAEPRYSGPPPTSAPPAEWRPPTVYEPSPPRELPAQNIPAVEAGEQRARTFTLGVGMVAGTVVLVVLFVLCGRALL